MYRVMETDAAQEDMRETLAYLNYRTGGKQASRNLLKDYERNIDLLTNNPFAFPLVADPLIAAMGYRWMPLRSYEMFYTVDRDALVVYIERVLHASRNWRGLL